MVKNTGSGTLNGWTTGWTFLGDQKLNDMWGGSYSQSGESVTATSESYDATLAPGATATVGFTGTYTSDASPSSVSCS